MQNTTLNALAASLRVVGDELITMADALKADATAAPLAQNAQQAFAQPPVQQPPTQQTQPPQQQWQQQPAQQQQWQPPVQQTQPPQQQWQQPPGQQQSQPPGQQQQTAGMEAPTTPATQPPTNDEFTAFSNELTALGRQAGPNGLMPIMGAMLQRYAGPPTNDLPTVPVESYGPFLEEVRAWIRQQQGGGQQ